MKLKARRRKIINSEKLNEHENLGLMELKILKKSFLKNSNRFRVATMTNYAKYTQILEIMKSKLKRNP